MAVDGAQFTHINCERRRCRPFNFGLCGKRLDGGFEERRFTLTEDEETIFGTLLTQANKMWRAVRRRGKLSREEEVLSSGLITKLGGNVDEVLFFQVTS
ncbi:hypothetical protein SRHO_G00163910 [Serrasalmus rhombeus]